MKILVIADVHGNAEALSAVLDKERDADATVFLGDTVLSGPQPNETMALLAEVSGTLILGNHDVEMLEERREPGRFSKWPPQWLAFTEWVLEELEPAGWELLASLKPQGEYEEGGVPMVLHHGVLPDQPKQALPDTSDERLVALARGSRCPLVLFGHSHIQFQRTVGEQTFINPGSVGQPRCGQNHAYYGLIEDGVFRHCHATYDSARWLEAVDRIEPLREFPEFCDWLKQGLVTGYGLGEVEPWTSFAAAGYV